MKGTEARRARASKIGLPSAEGNTHVAEKDTWREPDNRCCEMVTVSQQRFQGPKRKSSCERLISRPSERHDGAGTLPPL